MSALLNSLKSIATFPGTLWGLLESFESDIAGLKAATADLPQLKADVEAAVGPNESLAARFAAIDKTLADLVQMVSDAKAAAAQKSAAPNKT
jgi:hypothetical protein